MMDSQEMGKTIESAFTGVIIVAIALILGFVAGASVAATVLFLLNRAVA